MTSPHPARRPDRGLLIAAICIGAVALIALIAAVSVALLSGGKDDSADGSAAPTAARATALVAPEGIADDQPYIQYGDGADSDLVVDIYSDFLCPYCQQFHDANATDIKALAAEDGVTVRIHNRPMLDRASSPQGYSGRAANAALAVWEESPENYWAMEQALFAAQPEEGGAGLSDEELLDLAHQAGASSAVDEAITSGRYIPYLKQVVEADARAKDYGTPTVEINGEQVEKSLYTPGSLKQAVDAAR